MASMRFSTLLNHPAEWMTKDGPHAAIVVSSRIRLARNLSNTPFPGWAERETRTDILEQLMPLVAAHEQMKDSFCKGLGKLKRVEKQILVERHLISREHAARGAGSGTVINRPQTLSIMINEEDHLRMQCIRSGLQLEAAYEMVHRLDEFLEDQVPYAFHRDYGYLTACPSNVGTGMRASVMLHLPALVLNNRINQVINAANKLRLAVRGLYGEGTEAQGNLFQVSNQSTLGESEEQILERLSRVIQDIMTQEQNAREKLMEEDPVSLRDHVGRAYATLRFAHIISSKEAYNLISMIRLGTDLGILSVEHPAMMDHLLLEIQPAHLQHEAERELAPRERDVLRAERMRRKLNPVGEPDNPFHKA
ncbi:MAG: protein arginine kinase [Verrucomicrobiota bacterium]